jgi:hypothetical protein
MPEVVSLPTARPRGFAHLDQRQWASLVTERVRCKEVEHRQRRAAKGIAVLGRARILGQNPFHCPEGHAPRFQMSPRVAAKNSGHASRRSCATGASSSDTVMRSSATWLERSTSCSRSAPIGCASSPRSPARLPRRSRKPSSAHRRILPQHSSPRPHRTESRALTPAPGQMSTRCRSHRIDDPSSGPTSVSGQAVFPLLDASPQLWNACTLANFPQTTKLESRSADYPRTGFPCEPPQLRNGCGVFSANRPNLRVGSADYPGPDPLTDYPRIGLRPTDST